MAMIVDPDSLIIGTNITFNTGAKTFDFIASVDGSTTNGLIAKDGVDANALWSFFVDTWATATYKPYPFPMNKIDNRSGQYIFGRDPGGNYNGWKPGTDATRQMIRNGGWSEYSSGGVLNRTYFGAVLQGGVSAGSQCYYQKESTGPAIDYTFTDLPNEARQVYGDASNGNFNHVSFFKSFNRTYGFTFDDVSLTDISETATGPYKLPFGINTAADLNLTADDTAVLGAPYSTCTIKYDTAATSVPGFIGGSYLFKKHITHTAMSRFQIYTKMQYLLRQNSDINTGGTGGTVNGKTADLICWFVGPTLYSRAFFTPIAADLNDVVFIDDGGGERIFPYASAGIMNFNAPLTAGGTGYYTMFYTTTPAGDDYGEGTAVIVKDKDGVDISGAITGPSIAFTFDFSNNVQGGYAGSTNRNVTLVWGNQNNAKPGVSTGQITQSKAISIGAVAEADPSYIV
jgi:hypothetical protein